MSEWNRGEILALIGIIITVLIFVSQEILRRWSLTLSKDIVIHTPKNKDTLEIVYGEQMPIKRDIVGIITGVTKKEIQRLGLYVEVSITTDICYQQANCPVEDDGKWRVVGSFSRFNGKANIIRAKLKDSYGVEHKIKEIEVTVGS
jgi:hypothetical protein